MVVTLIGLKKIISYIFLISKTKEFGIGITFGFKNTFLKKKIAGVMPFHRKSG